MYQLALLYLACVLAGYGLANIPTSALITPEIANFFAAVGGIAMVVFALAVLYLGVKALFQKKF
ncbi:hypothetical protein F3157_22250 [Virgibacillus dakarensis]|uniref:Uncharacterized protein n=1 Tax=Lentibacillus populi TaxID=1827502 RepID=A0A9W5TXZ5_9BACI|nr:MULTISPECIES: hypothetical protein [Bacillaceae]MBT2218258.1 hypothetical protein [Virgibacillus dakarensis]MTW88303.1 hypothetical protein [Virgibacillus dakarensis]GGB42753.1 hypothetical protein GCM10011409_20430 [Lentibacillus populi]